MKIYLDDERSTPQGWVRAYWPSEVISMLSSGKVTDVSLDHDLGDDKRGTGYDVILWIEKEMVINGFEPPRLKVHSANISARRKMEQGISQIRRFSRAKRFN